MRGRAGRGLLPFWKLGEEPALRPCAGLAMRVPKTGPQGQRSLLSDAAEAHAPSRSNQSGLSRCDKSSLAARCSIWAAP